MIGERIRMARLRRGLTQEQLAGVLGVTKQMVSHIEVGRCEPTVAYIMKICLVCNTDADSLLFGSRQVKQAA